MVTSRLTYIIQNKATHFQIKTDLYPRLCAGTYLFQFYCFVENYVYSKPGMAWRDLCPLCVKLTEPLETARVRSGHNKGR